MRDQVWSRIQSVGDWIGSRISDIRSWITDSVESLADRVRTWISEIPSLIDYVRTWLGDRIQIIGQQVSSVATLVYEQITGQLSSSMAWLADTVHLQRNNRRGDQVKC